MYYRDYNIIAGGDINGRKCVLTNEMASDKCLFVSRAKLYIPSTLNNSNETHTFICLGRAGRFGQH